MGKAVFKLKWGPGAGDVPQYTGASFYKSIRPLPPLNTHTPTHRTHPTPNSAQPPSSCLWTYHTTSREVRQSPLHSAVLIHAACPDCQTVVVPRACQFRRLPVLYRGPIVGPCSFVHGLALTHHWKWIVTNNDTAVDYVQNITHNR